MKVNLKRNWFDPDGNRRKVRNNPHDLPAEWEKQLPPGAQVLEEVVAKTPVTKPAKSTDL